MKITENSHDSPSGMAFSFWRVMLLQSPRKNSRTKFFDALEQNLIFKSTSSKSSIKLRVFSDARFFRALRQRNRSEVSISDSVEAAQTSKVTRSKISAVIAIGVLDVLPELEPANLLRSAAEFLGAFLNSIGELFRDLRVGQLLWLLLLSDELHVRGRVSGRRVVRLGLAWA